MSGQNREKAHPFINRARDAAILVIAQIWPGQDFGSIETQFNRQPARVQVELTLSVLGYLLLLALYAGQFGPLGIMLYFTAVLITIR